MLDPLQKYFLVLYTTPTNIKSPYKKSGDLLKKWHSATQCPAYGPLKGAQTVFKVSEH